jgi:hypothetical protein
MAVYRFDGNGIIYLESELFVLGEFVDPELIFLPQKMEYPPNIQSIIDSR